MDFGDAVIALIVVALIGAAAWLITQVFTHKRQLGNLVDDVNESNAKLKHADAALAARGEAAKRDTEAAIAVAKRQAAAATSNAAQQATGRFDALGKVLAIPGDAFFNAATMRAAPNVDLTLLAHTTALAGVKIVGGIDVSGGAFSVDAASGVVRMCTSNACTEFNADGTTYLRSDATVFTGTMLDARGADVVAKSVSLSDVEGGIFAAGGTVNVAARGSAALSSVGPLVGGTYDVSTCIVDSASGLTVASAKMTSDDTLVPGSLKQVVKVTPAGNVTITTPSLTISAPTVDISGAITFHGDKAPSVAVGGEKARPLALAP